MSYLHGYKAEEHERLENQANYLQEAIHETVDFSNRKSLLEIGCGTGAQGRVILEKFSELKYTGIDISTIQNKIGFDKMLDASMYINYGFILSLDSLPPIAKNIIDLLLVHKSIFKK